MTFGPATVAFVYIVGLILAGDCFAESFCTAEELRRGGRWWIPMAWLAVAVAVTVGLGLVVSADACLLPTMAKCAAEASP